MLLRAMDDIAEGGPSPRFSEMRIKVGLLVASCADQATKDWVVQVVAEEAPWEGAKFRVIDYKGISKPIRIIT